MRNPVRSAIGAAAAVALAVLAVTVIPTEGPAAAGKAPLRRDRLRQPTRRRVRRSKTANPI